MSNRFLYYFIATTILISTYFYFVPPTIQSGGTSEIVLNSILFVYDFIIFAVYLAYKFIQKPNKKIIYLLAAYILMISFTGYETFNYYLRNWTTNTHIYLIIHSFARILLIFSIFPKKTQMKSPNLFYLIPFIIFSIIVIYFVRLKIENFDFKYPYPIFTYFYFSIIAFGVVISTAFQDFPKKIEYKILYFGLILIITSDFVNLQNYIIQNDLFSYAYMRILNTLGELGVVYFVLSQNIFYKRLNI